MGWNGSVFQYWLLSAVKSSGAVSPGGAGDGEQHRGDDAAQRRAEDHPEAGLPGRARRAPATPRAAPAGTSRMNSSVERASDGHHEERQRHAAGQRGEALHVGDHEAVGDDADDDGGHAGEHLGGEADDAAQRPVPLLGQEDPRADARRGSADEAREPHHEERPDDGVADAAAGLAHRGRAAREEAQAESPAAPCETTSQRSEASGTSAASTAAPLTTVQNAVDAPCASGARFMPAPPAARAPRPRPAARATAFRMRVMPKSTSPSAASAPTWTSPVASANSLAMTAGSE